MTSAAKLISIGLVLAVAACAQSSAVTISSRFSNSQDIVEGTSVMFNQQQVGKVIAVEKRDISTLVTIEISDEAALEINEHAAVVVNRLLEGAPLEIYNSGKEDSLGIDNGQELKGLNSMVELMAWSVGDAIDVGSSELRSYVDAFKGYLNSPQFENDKNRVQEQVQSATQDAVSALKQVEQEITKAIQDTEVNEEELAATVEQLGDELAPLVQEIAMSGSQLAKELEAFTQRLQEQQADGEITGTKFLESLLATLEKLSESIEQEMPEASKE